MVHLHTHSNYSLLDGSIRVKTLVARVRELGMTAVALTDHNGLYGAIEFYQTCVEQGIKPIIGAQISIENNTSLVLLTRNLQGYRNLCAIISEGHLRGGHLNFQGQLSDVIAHGDGLFVLSGGKQGPVTRLLAERRFREAEQTCRDFKACFGESFYLELQRLESRDDLLNARLVEIAERCDVPMVATNDVHLLCPEDHELRRVLHAIDRNTLLDRITGVGSEEQYLKSPGEMQKLFTRLPEALENAHRIAEQCDLQLSLGKAVFPVVAVPEGETPITFLRKLCYAGAEACYPALSHKITGRLDYELNIIHKLGFTDYFLIVKKIVDFCRSESIPCVGRGSAADSLVAYTLGITFADPIRFNLYFERFMNEDRSDPPDIDLDICWKKRDRVIGFVYKEFGHDKTAMICTFSTLQSRAALREVAKTFGLGDEEIKDLTRGVPYMARLSDNQQLVKSDIRTRFQNNEVYHRILNFSNRLADFPRHLSIHSGGVIIAPDKITNHVPLEVAGKKWVISQYDMYSVEKLGLVKMDLLGVRSLSIITDTLAAVNERKNDRDYGESKFHFLKRMKNFSPLDLRGFPEGDSEVLKMVNRGLTMGCFQLESPLMRGTLKKMQVRPLEDFPIAIAIIRPGVAHRGKRDEYLKYRRGLEKPVYLDDSLKDITGDTWGVPVFQEQVMLVAKRVAGFTLAQADGLRRVMTKSRKDSDLVASLERQFIEGSLRNGYSLAKAEEIWQYLFQFTGFGFNKAHAATYGILAYQTAFLKRYFTVEFMVSVINNPGAFYSTGAYISECRRLGIEILPPDVNRSEILFTIEGKAIRVGLFPVFELTDRTKESIITGRQEKPFQDIYDFIRRTNAGQKEVEHLIRCGALRSLDEREPVLLLKTQIYFKNQFNKSSTAYLTQGLDLPPYSEEQRIVEELHLLGFAVTAHPLVLYREVIPWQKMVPSRELEKYNGKRVRFTGWYVTKRTTKTKTDETMFFLTLEDLEDFCDVVFFPKIFSQHLDILRGHGPFTVTGRMQSRMPGEANLIAEKVERWPRPDVVVNRKLIERKSKAENGKRLPSPPRPLSRSLD